MLLYSVCDNKAEGTMGDCSNNTKILPVRLQGASLLEGWLAMTIAAEAVLADDHRCLCSEGGEKEKKVTLTAQGSA